MLLTLGSLKFVAVNFKMRFLIPLFRTILNSKCIKQMFAYLEFTVDFIYRCLMSLNSLMGVPDSVNIRASVIKLCCVCFCTSR